MKFVISNLYPDEPKTRLTCRIFGHRCSPVLTKQKHVAPAGFDTSIIDIFSMCTRCGKQIMIGWV